MSRRKNLPAVSAQTVTISNAAAGLITVPDTTLFKVGQIVILTSSAHPNKELEIKKITSTTAMILGPIGDKTNAAVDLSSYLSATVTVFANEQARPLISSEDIEKAVYEEEPTIAKRTVIVNKQGQIIDINNRLPVDIGNSTATQTVQFESKVSTLNSTSTPLGANQVFTGQWEDVRDYSAIALSILTDAPSATNGAVLQFSTDAVNVFKNVATTIYANTPGFFVTPPQARYMRVSYTNGSVAQTSIVSQIIFRFNEPGAVMQPLAAQASDLSIVNYSRAFLAGRLSSGAWGPIAVDSTGQMSVTGPVTVSNQPTDFPDAAANTKLGAIETKTGAIETKVATETTLQEVSTKLNPLATETTVAALKTRADVLATEATVAALKTRADALATETTVAALKTRADALATEATTAALKTRADLLATQATAANIEAAIVAQAKGTTADPIQAKLMDSNGNSLSSHGRVRVDTSLPAVPNGATAIDQSAIGSVAVGSTSTPTVVETAHTITTAKTLKISRFQAGAEASSNGSKIALFYQPNGNSTGEVFITALFVNGASNQQDLSKSYVGDGVRKIVLRRYNTNTIACEVFGRWEGYEE